tara:strand:- start:139199 stop:139414 length:216 start_codon:yes stop_codon:yes gene_type:complete
MRQLIAKCSSNDFLLEIDLTSKSVEASWYGSDSIDEMYTSKILRVETLLENNKLDLKSLKNIFDREEVNYA